LSDDGVAGYLLLVDPCSMWVTWANHNVLAVIDQRGEPSPVGRPVEDVVYLAHEIGLMERLRAVAATGIISHMSTRGFSVEGHRSRTDGSIYRLPSGDLLVASEFVMEPAQAP